MRGDEGAGVNELPQDVRDQASVFGCQCPGVPYLAGVALYPEPHWKAWEDYYESGLLEPWPAATQEDGLCDGCRDSCKAAAERWVKERQ